MKRQKQKFIISILIIVLMSGLILVLPRAKAENTALTIITESIPDAVFNADYSVTFAANGGAAPYTWEVLSSTYPSNHFLIDLSTGVFSNKVNGVKKNLTVGFWTIDIVVTDYYLQSVTKSFKWKVVSKLEIVASLLDDGTLVLDQGTIYVLEYGKKRPFVSMEAFNIMDYKLTNVILADTSEVLEGDLIANWQRHPRGSVVIDNSGTVYFLGQSLRYPFPSGEVFLSWGHNFGRIVTANPFDLDLSVGPIVSKKN